MDPVVVVGAGISGVAAARAMVAAGLEVVVLDRGHKVGGRMASRRTDGRMVDTGASYFTVSDPRFDAAAQDWRGRGLAREWTDTFAVAEDGALAPKSGPVRWAAPGGLRSLIEDLATDLDVRRQTVTSVAAGPLVDGLPAAAVVLAMPDPQARRLLDPAYAAEFDALDDPYAPALALTARWPERVWPDLDGVFVADHPVLAWIADDGRRRGDDAPVLVAHSTDGFAAERLADPESGVAPMSQAVREVLGIDTDPVTTSMQRWSFSHPTTPHGRPYHLGEARVGLCGDSWADKPRVEAAYLSGLGLGRELARVLG